MILRMLEFGARAIVSRVLILLVFVPLWGPAGGADENIAGPKVAPDNAVAAGMNEPNDGRMLQEPSVENLGKEKFRIGAITVDRAKRLITVPGRMLPHEENKAIEFIATIKQGFKAYESVMTLDANAFEFNLACILIGLNPDKSSTVKFHFDPAPVEGDRVSIHVGWQANEQWIEQDVIDLMKVDDTKPASPSVWVYTGSAFVEGDRYLAQMDGVLIGLIHDPASIIEHREGMGLGNWGSITVDSEVAPAGGQEIVLKVRSLD